MTAGELHLRRFQEIHGEFPELLLEFLLSEARWEVRLCAWLLWLMKSGFDAESPLRPHSPWRTYINTLPHLDDLSTLLSYSPLEQRALAIPKYASVAEPMQCSFTSRAKLSPELCTAGTSESLKFKEMWQKCSITRTFMA